MQRETLNGNWGVLRLSIGFRLVAGGMWRKSILSGPRQARRFLPMTLAQAEGRCSKDTSREVPAIFIGSDHLCSYSLHAL